MAHADFTFYRDVYHGAMQEAEFSRLIGRAAQEVIRLTRGRTAAAAYDETKLAECAVADVLREDNDRSVVRESVGRYTVQYADGTHAFGTRIYDAAALYLENTGLLYAGI